ncbi:MAG: hypothetical protein IJE01_02130 [Clostridia bacterium]|nr:hypothetical protein [Clostridia bacterium]
MLKCIKKICSLVIVSAIIFAVSLPAKAVNTSVNGKECVSSYSINHDRTKNSSSQEFKFIVNGSVLSAVNLPNDQSFDYGFGVFEPVTLNSNTGEYIKTTVSSGISYYQSSGVSDYTATDPKFNLQSINYVTPQYVMGEATKVKSGTYLFSLCTSDRKDTESFNISVSFLIEVDSSQNVGIIFNSEFYNINLEKKANFENNYKKDYYKNYYSSVPTDGSSLTVAEEEYVKSLAEYIVKDIPENSSNINYLKSKAVYNWLAENLYYDYDFFYNSNGRPSDTDVVRILQTKKAVCEGFAVCYTTLLNQLNIESAVVYGFAPGQGGNEENFTPGTDDVTAANHAWNEVNIDGQWILVDSTWGCSNSYYNGRFTKGAPSFLYFDAHIQMFSQSLLSSNPVSQNAHCTVMYDSPLTINSSTQSFEELYFKIPQLKPLKNGAAFTKEALNLPDKITKITPTGSTEVDVFWDLKREQINVYFPDDCYYDPNIKNRSQSFVVYGLVDDCYIVTIRVTVLAQETSPKMVERHAHIIVLEQLEGYEYRVNGGEWKASPYFKGLLPDTNYTFEQRKIFETEDFEIIKEYCSIENNISSATFTTADRTDFLPGDIDDDGTVNMDDIVALAKHLSYWDSAFCDCALDPNNDGEETLYDVVYLARHLLGWEGYEKLSEQPFCNFKHK